MARPRARRRIRRVGTFLFCVVAVLTLPVILLMLPPVRAHLMQRAVRALDGALPGRFEAQAHWSWPAQWVLEHVTWTHDGTRLLSAEHVRVHVHLGALARRDLVLERLSIQNLHANLPAMTAAFAHEDETLRERLESPQSEPGEADRETQAEAATLPYLRTGAVPGFPSLQIRELSMHVPWVVLSDADTLTAAALRASVDVLSGDAPMIYIAHVEGALVSRGIELHPGSATLDLERGTIQARLAGRLGPDWPFSLTSSGADANTFDIALLFPGRDIEARAQGRWQRRGAQPVAVEFTATAHTSDPQQLELGVLRRWTPARLELVGRLELEDRLRGTTQLAATIQQPWFREAVASLRFDADGVVAESLFVHLDGLALRGDVSLSQGELRSTVRADYHGTEWLQAFADSLSMPDSLRMHVELEARGESSRPRVTLQAHGALRSGAVPIDSLALHLEAENGIRAPLHWSALLEAASYRLASQGVLSLPDASTPWHAQLQPIQVRRQVDAPPAADLRRAIASDAPGVMTYDAQARHVAATNVQVVGDLGQLVVAADLDLTSGGTASATARWPRPPAIVAIADSVLEALRLTWPREPVPHARVEARVAGEDEGFRTRVDGSMHLPGPTQLTALLPSGWDFSGLGFMDGRFALDIGDSTFGYIDLGPTSWIDTCRAEWSHTASRSALESVQLRLEGVGIDADLALDGDDLSGELRVRADQAGLLKRLRVWGDSTRASWDGRIDLGGTREAPRLDARVDANLASPDWTIPTLHANLALQPGTHADIQLVLAEGVATAQTAFRLDSVRVHYRTQDDATGRWLGAGRLRLELEGPDFGLRETARLELDPELRIRFDSLTIRLRDRELYSTRPFEFARRAGERSYAVHDLQLEGSMGRLVASGETSPDTMALHVEARLNVPARPAWLPVPDAVWPTYFELEGQGSSHDDVHLSATLHGTQLSHNTDLRMQLELAPATRAAASSPARGFEARLSLAGDDTLVAAAALLPVRFEQFPLRVQTLDDSLRVRARWREIPFALTMPEEGLAEFLDSSTPKPLLSGRLHVSGRGAAPDVELDADIQFPHEGIRDYSVTIGARGNGAERTRTELNVRHAQRSIATGQLDVPLRFSFAPFTLQLADGELSAQVRADSVDLEKLTPVLPSGASAKGLLVADLRASGPANDPQLRGSMRLEGLDLELTGRRTVRLNFSTQLAGSWRAPDVTGTLRIEQARLRIPERENLLPTQAQPLLWKTLDADSLVRPAVVGASPGTPLLRVPRDARLALKIDVPSGFWIVGNDLGIELKGDLDAGIENQSPVVQGRLEAVQGWFTLMGRNFELASGRCDFDGLNALNPTLRIEMRTQVRNTKIFVTITGDVEEPELKLRSEPEMSEGDIMAMLVFGQSADQLGSGQGDFLAAQVAALAQSYSGAALQQVVGDQLGIDTVRFKSRVEGEDNSARTSIEVGKYLTSNVLLQWEIDLHTGHSRGVTMEYRMTDRLKLDSHVRPDRSGVEFNWSRDY